MASLRRYFQLIRNMGFRYIMYRTGFELKKRSGLIKRDFPTSPPSHEYIDLNTWRKGTKFFGVSQTDPFPDSSFHTPDILAVLSGEIDFFSSRTFSLGKGYDWVTNPETGFQYNNQCHWAEIQDYCQTAGDIKFVWEKSRFAYLYQVIRHDHFTSEDHSKWVFDEINSWLNANPINCGPNYKCSQEISLRVLNWTYALNFYKDSEYLTADLFAKIMHAIYWQIKHVYSNINFSRIAVRNNHALTETLFLYLSSLYYPFFPEAKTWRLKGKAWFEQEVDYQIYNDGTFLQFSMNYHRVVIQLFTWAFRSAECFNDKFSQRTYDKAYKSLKFLFSCQDEETGWLPNYGNNDGALFFRLNSCDFRDYRPQLNVLHQLLTGESLYTHGPWQEDVYWMNGGKVAGVNYPPVTNHEGWSEFNDGGYFILREQNTLTFIRCGNHKDRPAQADNLHLDIWYKGQNVVFDGGSYKYNTDFAMLKYFMGTESHNTVMLNNEDQMLKGSRFIWYNWSQALKTSTGESDATYYFEGRISAFQNINPKACHTRKIKKYKGKAVWEIEDEIFGKPSQVQLKQRWHTLPCVNLKGSDKQGSLELIKEDGFRSDYYGLKQNANQFLIQTHSDSIHTTINIG